MGEQEGTRLLPWWQYGAARAREGGRAEPGEGKGREGEEGRGCVGCVLHSYS